jgi:RNA polymerase sigma factor (sigma-70 family)
MNSVDVIRLIIRKKRGGTELACYTQGSKLASESIHVAAVKQTYGHSQPTAMAQSRPTCQACHMTGREPMTQTITNYTTYDLAYYYADLQRIPRLSEEQRRHLLVSLPAAHSPLLDIQVKHHLMESYLPLAKHFAIALCPKSCSHRDLPDLIGAANLSVVEVISRADLTQVADLTGYLSVCVRGAIQRTIGDDALIHIPSGSRTRARANGTLERPYAMQPLSLDAAIRWDGHEEAEEPVTCPILPTNAAPPRDPAHRAQVEEYLSYLSPRQQMVFRLRYGLSDEDERAYTVIEIARILGLNRKTVDNAVRSGLARLRALVARKAALVEKQGHKRIAGIVRRQPLYPTLTPEQEATFQQASSRLSEQGSPITYTSFAQASGLSVARATVFLRQRRSSGTWQEQQQRHASDQVARQCCLEDAYHRLLAQGIPVTHRRLAQEAHMSKNVVCSFLREKRGMSRKEAEQARAEARQQQLEATYDALLAQGIPPTYERLAHAARTSNSTVRAFLRSKRGANHAAA